MIRIPAEAVVLLIGASGSGKSTFAARHFDAAAIVSSDQLRDALGDDEADQRATEAAFDRLHQWLDGRLGSGALAVLDATNVDWMRRASLIEQALRYHRPVVAIVFDLGLDLCLARNAARPRSVAASIIRAQHQQLRHDLDRLDLEGFGAVHVLRSPDEVEELAVEIEKGPVARPRFPGR
jgi:protein phosphatase